MKHLLFLILIISCTLHSSASDTMQQQALAYIASNCYKLLAEPMAEFNQKRNHIYYAFSDTPDSLYRPDSDKQLKFIEHQPGATLAQLQLKKQIPAYFLQQPCKAGFNSICRKRAGDIFLTIYFPAPFVRGRQGYVVHCVALDRREKWVGSFEFVFNTQGQAVGYYSKTIWPSFGRLLLRAAFGLAHAER